MMPGLGGVVRSCRGGVVGAAVMVATVAGTVGAMVFTVVGTLVAAVVGVAVRGIDVDYRVHFLVRRLPEPGV